jgi:predicted phosphoribosyltransferase
MYVVSDGGAVRLPLRDRRAAGRSLAARLGVYAGRDDVTVLALPRGGVPVAYEIARSLGAPLDLQLVRKLGVPGREELAMGAIASGGAMTLDRALIATLGVTQRQIAVVTTREREELARRERTYLGDRSPATIAGHTVLLVDDGVATGSTALAALAALRARSPARVIVVAPTASCDAAEALAREADGVVILATPEPYIAVGRWYRDFRQTDDRSVQRLLAAAEAATKARAAGPE